MARVVALLSAFALGSACGLDLTGVGGGGAPPGGDRDATVVDPAAPMPSDGGADDVVSVDSDAGADAGTDARDASIDACVPPASGIVGWWTGDGTLVDRIGGNNGVSGTQMGASAVTFKPGEVDQAFDFLTGAHPYVQITSVPVLDIAGSITMDAWVSSTNFGGRIVDKQTAGGADGYMLDTYNGYPRIIITGVNLFGPAKLPTGTWIHEAGTWDGTTMRLYVNGVEVANAPAKALPHNDIALRIGADNTGASHFEGLVDEVAIHSRALSAGEIQAIYLAGKAGRCR
jgi:hypothetical protein